MSIFDPNHSVGARLVEMGGVSMDMEIVFFVAMGVAAISIAAAVLILFGLKVLFSIALLLVVVTPSIAADFTYKDYAKASDVWKRGFVLGISQYMSAVAQPDEEAPYPVRNAYQRCFASSTEVLLVRQVETYVARNPVSSNEPMVRVVIRALFHLCQPEIEKIQSPKAAPSRR
jgi:hypothetical protein